MLWNKQSIDVTIIRQEYNLPIFYNYYVTSEKNKCHRTLLRLGMAFIGLDYLDLLGYLRTDTYSSGTER